MRVIAIRTNGLDNPLGLEDAQPYFSWQLESDEQNEVQTAYEIIVGDSQDMVTDCRGNLWQSGKINSDNNVYIPYEGAPLKSKTTYYWRVRCWGAADVPTSWSSVDTFETAFFKGEPWKADWIGAPGAFVPQDLHRTVMPQPEEASPRFRKTFTVKQNVTKARLYVSGLGICYTYINGKPVNDWVLEPAHTDYEKTVPYRTMDVTAFLQQGNNVIAAELGRGFYDIYEESAWNWHNCDHRSNPKLKLQLEITDIDGNTQLICTDETWRMSREGPTRYNSIYFGETYDANRQMPGWTTTGFCDENWQQAALVNTCAPKGRMTSLLLPPMRIIHTWNPKTCKKMETGAYVLDAGKQLSGWLRIRASASQGTTIRITYGEKLEADDSLFQWSINGTSGLPQTDYYTFGGGAVEEFAPKFHYKGFRYAVIESLDSLTNIVLEDAVVEEVHSDVKVTGDFSCSHPLLNQLHKNMVSTMLHNFHGKPTDCPAYEKNGWLGDAQVILEDALYNFDVHTFLKKYYQDILDTMWADGSISQIAPAGKDWGYIYAAEWQTASVLIPWKLYWHTGDISIFQQTYEQLKQIIDRDIARLQGDLSCSNMGDWVAPGVDKRESGPNAPEGPDVTCNCFAAEAFLLFSKIAGLLGHKEEENYYFQQAERTRRAMNAMCLTKSGAEDEYLTRKVSNNQKDYTETYRLNDGTFATVGYRQTSNVLPVMLGKTPSEQVSQKVIDRLAAEIQKNPAGPHLDTGFVGTKYLLPALTEYGYGELAYQIAVQTTYPGWGYFIEQGADSCYETWESSARSYQHYFLGTGDEWLFRYLAGIHRNEKAGFLQLVIKPYVLGDLTYAEASIETVLGKVSSKWERLENNCIQLEVFIPVNAKATVHAPVMQDGRLCWQVYETGSGQYRFLDGQLIVTW